MTLPRYPEYKDSGVEWLGEVPENWTTKRFRYVFQESREKIERDVVGPMLSVSGYRGIEVKEYDDENRRRSDDDLIGYRIVRVGQLVVNTMWLNYAGLGVSAHEGHVSPAYRCYDISEVLHKGFAHHLMRSGIYVLAYTRLLTGVRPNSLQMSRNDLMEFPVLLPPLSDQAVIADFLNQETTKIDALVSEQQRLMGLLKEKRQAVISHAVTRGLNPDAPMKPSGIEWLGDVPAHWEEYPLKALFSIKHGYAFDGAAFSDSGEHVLMTPGHFHEKGGFRRRDSEKFYVGDDIPLEFILQSGQMLVAMTEQAPGLLGSALFVPDGASYLHNQRLGLVRGLRSEVLSERFLFHLLNSPRLRGTISVSSTGAKVKHTSPSRILSIQVILPPLSEQLRIAAFLDRKTLDFDELEAAAQKSIALLQERRTALISAAVTGQIDVRGVGESSAS